MLDNESESVPDFKDSHKDMNLTALENLWKGSTGIDSDWLPDSQGLTFTKANQTIPIMLFNFISWCLRFECEPVTD